MLKTLMQNHTDFFVSSFYKLSSFRQPRVIGTVGGDIFYFPSDDPTLKFIISIFVRSYLLFYDLWT